MSAWPGATYGFLAPPRCAEEPRPHPDGSRYSAAFPVKFLGSGPVQHYTDYDGCLKMMNQLYSSYQLSSKRRLRRRSNEGKNEHLFLTFTPKRLFIINMQTQVLEEMCKLEAVYLVHPHPTKERLFGLLTDNWMSGTLHCSAYVTIDNTTGSDVLYGFRKACRIWTDLHQNSENSSDEPEPSFTIPSIPSGEYDKLDRKTSTEILVSFSESNSSFKSKLSQKGINLDKCAELSEAMSELRDLDLSPSTPSSLRLNENKEYGKTVELRPLLLSMESTSSEFHSPPQTPPISRESISNDSKGFDSCPLLERQDTAGATSLDLSGENSSSTESRTLSERRVSFAPSVVTSKITFTTDANDEKTLDCKLTSNLHSIRSMVTRKKGSSSSSLDFPQLHPCENPLPLSNSNSSPVSKALETEISTPDLIDFSTESSLKTINTETESALGSGTNSQSQFTAQDPTSMLERSISSPAIFLQSESDRNTSDSSIRTPATRDPPEVYDSPESSMSYLSISSASSSITSLEPSSSSQRALSNHGSSESLSVHRSLHQLHTTSNSNTPSKWTSISDLAPPTMQNVNILKQLCSKSSSTSSTENVFTNRVNISDLLENPSEHASAETRECTENDNQNLSLPGYTAEAVDDKDTDSSTPLSLASLFRELQSASDCGISSSGSSEATLAKLFRNLASQTSRVSSQFFTLGRLIGEDSEASSDTILAQLFSEQQASFTSTTTGSELLSASKSSKGLSDAPSHVSSPSKILSGDTLPNLFGLDSSCQSKPAVNESESLSTGELCKKFVDSSSQTLSPSKILSGDTLANLFRYNSICQSKPAATGSESLSTDELSKKSIHLSSQTLSPSKILSGDTLPNLFRQKTTSTSTMSSPDSESTKWSDAKLSKLLNSDQLSLVPEPPLPAVLLSLTKSALSTSFIVSESKVIDLPSLMETLKHVTSLLASSHAILELSIATLNEKLASQPPGVCVCTCPAAGLHDNRRSNVGESMTQEDANMSQSEPVLRAH